MPAISSEQKNAHFASFATTSRLIACLTSESLVPVFFVPLESNGIVGLCLLLRQLAVKNESDVPTSLTVDDILAVVPLRGVPIFSFNTSDFAVFNGIVCPRIQLVDGWDMLPHIFSASSDPSEYEVPASVIPNAAQVKTTAEEALKNIVDSSTLYLTDNYYGVALWERLAEDLKVNNKLSEQIGQELESSIDFQKHTYDNPKPLPTINSTTYEWEQSVVEGHATHPMHKARKSFPPMPPLIPGSYDFDHPNLRLVGIPRGNVTVRGDYEELVKDLVDAMLDPNRDPEVIADLRQRYAHLLFIPIHELQIPNIETRFPDTVILSEKHSAKAEALASLRSVALPDILPSKSVKLCLGIKISSALRTVTPFTTYFGPGFSEVVPKLTYDRDILFVERELGTATYAHEDTDVAKHCSSVIRDAIEYNPEYKDDLFVPCGALVEKIQKPDTDETLVKNVWNLDTEEKKIDFLKKYVDLSLRAFLPPCLENGVAFEAHGQNTMARFDRKTGELKGFVIRDFGGVKVHRETLKKTTGCELDVLPDSCVVAYTEDEVFKLLYHTLFHCQFQRLIRVLDLHYNGVGWNIVNERVAELVPKDHIMRPYFMENERVPGKCLVRMKIDELYRDYIYRPVPNMIQFRPQSLEQFKA